MELSLGAFALMSLVVVMTPGPTVLLALSNGSRYGFGGAGYGIAGAAISDAVLIFAVFLGLGAILTASAFWFALVKWIGVAYLFWVGLQMLRSSDSLGATADWTAVAAESRGSIFRKSLLVAVTNPKGYLFFTAFLPQFLVVSEPLLRQYAVLALIFIAVDVAVMAIYAGLGAHAYHCLKEQGAHWMDRCCGSLLIALSGALAFIRRGEA